MFEKFGCIPKYLAMEFYKDLKIIMISLLFFFNLAICVQTNYAKSLLAKYEYPCISIFMKYVI